MDKISYKSFMTKYGEFLVNTMQRKLDATQTQSPGFNNDAYNTVGKDGDNWTARKNRNSQYAKNVPKSPFGQGALSNSISYTYDDETNELMISMLDYWKYVEYGRKPGTYTPIAPLMEWAKQKLGDSNAAYGIRRNIYKYGIKPTPFYGVTIDETTDKIATDFGEDAGELVNEFLDNLFEDIIKSNDN